MPYIDLIFINGELSSIRVNGITGVKSAHDGR